MAELKWDQTGEKFYETGVDHGVLYLPDDHGKYTTGVVWNGLVTVTEAPSGAEANPQYADNIKYLNLLSAEEFGGTIEAFTYPDEFEECDGSKALAEGVLVSQQARRSFGMAYRSKIGNDLKGMDAGYKIHLIYGALAAPSEKAYSTVNDSPEAITFSWEITTTPVDVPGDGFKPTSHIVIDSTRVSPEALAAIEAALYGRDGKEANLPLPADIVALAGGQIV